MPRSVDQYQLFGLSQQIPQWQRTTRPWMLFILPSIDHELRRLDVRREVEVGGLRERWLHALVDSATGVISRAAMITIWSATSITASE